MIDLGVHGPCVCQNFENKLDQCVNAYTVRESGKSVKLIPSKRESVMTIILDGCVMQDNETKCDALFLYAKDNRKCSFLVELKGAGDLPKAFEQLGYTRYHRQEYLEIIQKLNELPGNTAKEIFVIVSNGQLTKPEQERLENEHRVRVKKILYCEGNAKIPDLREAM